MALNGGRQPLSLVELGTEPLSQARESSSAAAAAAVAESPRAVLARNASSSSLSSAGSSASDGSAGSSGPGGGVRRRRSAGAAARLSVREKRAVADLLLRGGYAYRVLSFAKGSPSEQLGLVPFFDFIVKGDSVDFVKAAATEEANAFSLAVGAKENQALRLKVYNCKNRTLRNLIIKPRRWVARGISSSRTTTSSSNSGLEAGLTGLKVVFDTRATGVRVVRVLNVLPGSPADCAGLQAMTDYLLGTTGGVAFRSSHALLACLKESADRTLELLVYSSVADTVRVVSIAPSGAWANNDNGGKLGCDIGIGPMHSLPDDARDSFGTFRAQRLLAGASSDELDLEPVAAAAAPLAAGLAAAAATKLAPPTARPPSARPIKHQVKTELGYGQALGECAQDGTMVIDLDWKLPNGCVAVMFAQTHSYRFLPPLHEQTDR